MAEFKFENGEWWYCWGKTNKTRAEQRECEYCGEKFLVMKCRKSKYCSKRCSALDTCETKPKGDQHYAWKGGVRENRGYAYVHKSLAEIKHGAFFEDGEWWYYYGRKPCRTRAIEGTCKVCGKKFWTMHKKSQHCSQKCILSQCVNKKGEDNHRWNGGVRVVPKGYAEVFVGDLPGTTRKYKRRCRLVMEEVLGRELLPTEHVHHLNGDKLDDRPENLELWTTSHPYGVRAASLIEPEYLI
jgi:hypothetical protein